MKMEWKEGFKISINTCNKEVTISANKEGLLSLAGQLQALAEGMPGDHIHYDEYNSLEPGLSEMIIELKSDGDGSFDPPPALPGQTKTRGRFF